MLSEQQTHELLNALKTVAAWVETQAGQAASQELKNAIAKIREIANAPISPPPAQQTLGAANARCNVDECSRRSART